MEIGISSGIVYVVPKNPLFFWQIDHDFKAMDC
jgi:hypothetical protein